MSITQKKNPDLVLASDVGQYMCWDHALWALEIELAYCDLCILSPTHRANFNVGYRKVEPFDFALHRLLEVCFSNSKN